MAFGKSSRNLSEPGDRLMKIPISFADLGHSGHFCNTTTPYGVSLVAAYALQSLGDQIDAKIVKLPAALSAYLEKTVPKVACFSSFTWGFEVSYAFARRIKQRFPSTVTVFGGPNYPLETDKQEKFLLGHPAIDFYICRDGELPFLELLKTMMERDFDIEGIKRDRMSLPSCHYVSDGTIVRGDLAPTFKDLDLIPSPYLMGLLDEFLRDDFTPLFQTTRGCPFFCTFCEESDAYFNKIRRYSLGRIREELHYMAQRATIPLLKNADSNFGMFEEDLDICRELVATKRQFGWPKVYEGISGKNKKERLIEAARILAGHDHEGGSTGLTNIYLSAAVQSMDPEVLRNINRSNISVDDTMALARAGTEFGSNSVSEIILCLPGDTRKAHFDALFDMMDCGINKVRAHQLTMLPGAELATKSTREKFKMRTAWRVHPNTVIPYEVFGETFYAPEIDEICVENSTMSFEDYLECRVLCLTIEVFYNEDIFKELLVFLRKHGVSFRTFILEVNDRVRSDSEPLRKVYEDFWRESHEIFESRAELMAFLDQPGIRKKHEIGEMGNNEQMMYRAIMRLRLAEDLHQAAFGAARRLLGSAIEENPSIDTFLRELQMYSLARRTDMFSTDKVIEHVFHYDFVGLEEAISPDAPDGGGVNDGLERNSKDALHADPFVVGERGVKAMEFHPEGIRIVFEHTQSQKEYIQSMISTYGLSDQGLGNIFGCLSAVDKFYRQPIVKLRGDVDVVSEAVPGANL